MIFISFPFSKQYLLDAGAYPEPLQANSLFNAVTGHWSAVGSPEV